METIKNYLETMFSNMPDNEQTRRAKQELLAMMEDKYNELISSGMPQNEVIGTIISEFGNLDEITETLGLNKNEVVDEAYNRYQVEKAEIPNRRLISLQEASEYIMDMTFSRFLLSLGVFCCILAPAGPIMGEGFDTIFGENILSDFFEGVGVIFLFVAVAVGVGFIILSSSKKKEWNFLKRGACVIDSDTAEYLRNERAANNASSGMMLALGIVLCIVCVVPVTMFGIFSISDFLTEALGPSMIFFLSGLGVFFILNSSRKAGAYNKLLSLNK